MVVIVCSVWLFRLFWMIVVVVVVFVFMFGGVILFGLFCMRLIVLIIEVNCCVWVVVMCVILGMLIDVFVIRLLLM